MSQHQEIANKDTYVSRGTPDTPHGTEPDWGVTYDDSGSKGALNERRALFSVDFALDLPDITAAQVDSAYLYAYNEISSTGTAFGIQWQRVIPNDTGTSTGSSSTTLTDTSKSWTANVHVGREVICNGKTLIVTSNTATVLTGSAGWVGGDPGSPNFYTITWGEITVTYTNQPGHTTPLSDTLYAPFNAWKAWTVTDIVKDAITYRAKIFNVKGITNGFTVNAQDFGWFYSRESVYVPGIPNRNPWGNAKPYLQINYTVGAVRSRVYIID